MALSLALVFPLILFGAHAEGRPNLYSVIFQVTADAHGKVGSLKIHNIYDASSHGPDPVSLALPETYLSAVRKLVSAKTYRRDGKPFYAAFYYDTAQPGRADISPYNKLNSNHFDFYVDNCDLSPCRENLDVKLKDKEGNTFDANDPLLPGAVVSYQGNLLIFSGETIYIEAEESELGPVNLRQVQRITHPEKTIVFKFVQTAVPDKGLMMLLTVKNPFSRAIQYPLGLMYLDLDEYYYTSTCPVKAGGSTTETWPDPIYKINVGGMTFANNSSKPCNSTHPPLHKSKPPVQISSRQIEQVIRALDNASSVTLYSTCCVKSPKHIEGELYGASVLGHLDLGGEQEKQVIRHFRNAIASGMNKPVKLVLDDWCNPQHILRVASEGKTYDFMPCSEFKTLRVESETTAGYLNFMGEGLRQELDTLLDKANVPVRYSRDTP